MTPRCPFCNTQGISHLAADPAGLFLVVYCGQCGAIYGVIPAPAPQKTNQDKIKTAEPEPAPPTEPEPERLSPDRAAALVKQMYGGYNRRK